MSKQKEIKSLILPGESPPSESQLKRQLLFFDSILIIHPDDRALINEGEIVEKFPNTTIKWAEQNSFPRVADYEEKFEYLLERTLFPQKKGLIKVVTPTSGQIIDPGINWTLFHTAITNSQLVKSAKTDKHIGSPKFQHKGIVLGLAIAQTGYQSKYKLDWKPPANDDIEDDWTVIGYLRIARMIKSLRRAYGEGANPVSIDAVNQSILTSLSNEILNSLGDTSPDLASLSISMDVVDPVELESALEDMSWEEVREIRKRILPKVAELRSFLLNKVHWLHNRNSNDIEIYLNELKNLKLDYENKKKELKKTWEQLRIASILKTGGIVGTGNIGLSLLPMNISWIDWMMKLIGTGLVGTAVITPELKSLIPARREVKKHPLFFCDYLPPS